MTDKHALAQGALSFTASGRRRPVLVASVVSAWSDMPELQSWSLHYLGTGARGVTFRGPTPTRAHALQAMGGHSSVQAFTYTHPHNVHASCVRGGWGMEALRKRWTRPGSINGWWEEPRSVWTGSKVIGPVGGKGTDRHSRTGWGPAANDSGLLFSREE